MELVDPASLDSAGSAPPADLTKIGTNNRLRRFLRTTLARFALSNPDAAVRLAAVSEMVRALDDTTIDLLRQRAGTETDDAVKYEIDTGLALAALDDPDRTVRLAAIATLRDRLRPEVRNRLAALVEPAADGAVAETDDAVRAAAASAVETIDTMRSLYSGVETLFFGLSLGSVLVLVAIGLAITFGVMGVINMAHGELMMLGAYTTYVVQLLLPDHIEISILAGDSRGVPRGRTGRRDSRADHHPVPLWPPARDAAGDLRREPGAPAAGALRFHRQQHGGGDAGLAERHAPGQRGARPHLQPACTSSPSR